MKVIGAVVKPLKVRVNWVVPAVPPVRVTVWTSEMPVPPSAWPLATISTPSSTKVVPR